MTQVPASPAAFAPAQLVRSLSSTPEPDPDWSYRVTNMEKTETLSEWNSSEEALIEAQRVGGRVSKIARI